VTQHSFVSPSTRSRVRGWAVPVALALGRLGLTPNALTIIGFIGVVVAAVAAASQAWTLAGVLVLAFGIFDLFDGALARATGRASKFGAFLDSTLDRTGENLVLAGITAGCAVAYYLPGAISAGLALAFASVVTYARAKAEVIGLHGEVGFAPREIRLVVLAVGLIVTGITGGVSPSGLLSLPPPEAAGNLALFTATALIALLSAITVIQRILHVRRQLEQEHS
jgi:CDP-diacylglycerol---glycerol-3-phosphate 3-phosphatidyltransferase